MGDMSDCVGLDERRVGRMIDWLSDWARWNQGYSISLGYPSKTLGMSSGYVSSTFDDVCEASDQEVFRIIDTAIDDLGREHPAQKAAILRRYLAVSWRFPRGNYEEALLNAHVWLIHNLPKRGVMV